MDIEEFVEPIKEKFALGAQAVTYLGKPLSFLHLQNASYISTGSVNRGSFGKIRYGLSNAWQVYVIKEFRLGDQVGRLPGKKTLTSPRQQVVDELRLTRFLRNVIDQELGRRERLDVAGHCPYASLREKRVDFELIDFQSVRLSRPGKTDVHKLYAVMTREAGNLIDLRQSLCPKSYGPAALSLAAQGFAELAIMHDKAKYAHMDISPGNVLFNGHGQFKLMDFGLCRALVNGSTLRKGLRGTLAAPEMVAGYDSEVDGIGAQILPELTAAVDVYALGILIAQFASGYPWSLNPFRIPDLRPTDAPDQREATLQYNFLRFEHWKEAHRTTPTGDVHVNLIEEGKPGTFGHFFYGLATGCPPLCELLLNRVLVLDPRRRASAAQVDLQLRALLPGPDDLGMKLLRVEMRRIEKRQNMDALRHKAQKFAAQVGQLERLAQPTGSDVGEPHPV